MATIGNVILDGDRYRGQLNTVTIQASIEIAPNHSKANDRQPDFRVYVNGAEIGAGWNKYNKSTAEQYLSISMDDPSFDTPIHANLGKAAGQDDPNAFALIWNRPRRR
ncbi:MAG: DUF736 domain-containing protein [Geminicoccaceae bacterium]